MYFWLVLCLSYSNMFRSVTIICPCSLHPEELILLLIPAFFCPSPIHNLCACKEMLHSQVSYRAVLLMLEIKLGLKYFTSCFGRQYSFSRSRIILILLLLHRRKLRFFFLVCVIQTFPITPQCWRCSIPAF